MSLSQVAAELVAKLQTAPRAAFYLDFDGTLAPFVQHPEEARAPESTIDTLAALATDPRFTIAIVSGRSLADLKPRVPIPGLVFVGNHGLEIEGRGLSFRVGESASAAAHMRAILTALTERLRSVPGAEVEDKGLTASVHFRRVEPSRRVEVAGLVLDTIAPDDPELVLRDAKMVVEIRPRTKWNKGEGVLWVRKELGLEGAVEIYIGDDTTDEDAFLALPEAFTIRVGPADHTAARYRLADHTEVAALLKYVLDAKELYRDA